jgi:hypothetical protein
MDESIGFYLKHASKINEALATREKAKSYIVEQLNKACGLLNERNDKNGSLPQYEVKGSSSNYKLIKPSDHNEIYYTLFLDDFLVPEKAKIILELFGQMRNKKHLIEAKLNDTPQGFTKGDQSDSNYVHFLLYEMDLKIVDYEELGRKIKEAIAEQMEPVRQKIIGYYQEIKED